jgi:ABC-2 type transport system permease protein
MNTESNAMPETPLDSQAVASAAMVETRPFYWSVRRELWENRSIYIAPLVAAAIAMLAFFISLVVLPHSMHQLAAVEPAHQSATLAQPYAHAAMLLMLTAFLVGIFYSLDALHGERRERSILFWKSLPVSDLTTVLSKAVIPLAVLPAIVFALAVVSQVTMLLMSTAVLLLSGAGTSTLWARVSLFEMGFVLLYSLIVLTLWHAPIYAWLLLVSGWARRATFLWAVLPWLAIAAFERLAFRTSYFGLLLQNRMFGFAAAAFNIHTPRGDSIDPHLIPLSQLAPGRLLSSPGLWLGLIFAAACLAAAVRLRRYREPI